MKDTATVNDRSTFVVAILSLVAGLVSSGFGYFNAMKTNQIAERQQQIEGREKFAGLVRDSIDALGDRRKAGLSLAAIYAVAEDEDEKRIAITIAAATHSPDVWRVLAVLVSSDEDAKTIAQDAKVLALIAPNPENQGAPTAEAETSAESLWNGASKVGHLVDFQKLVADIGDLRPQSDTAQTDLLAAIAKPEGWVYYGRLGGARNNDAVECLPKSTPIPKAGDVIHLCSPRYLRATKPNDHLGTIVGVAKASTPLRVKSVYEIPLSGNSRAIWTEVANE